jgi:quinol-cytochrome oxidoreductase complex cytochrome b subunit
METTQTTHPEGEKDSVPFFPNHFMTEFYVVVGIIILALVVGTLGMLFPVGLGAPADPLDTPLHVKPEWYFLALYQILKFVPSSVLGIEGPMFAVTMMVLAVLVVIIWPFLDRKEDSKKAMRIRAIVTVLGVILAIALTIWGEVS